ncbi:MAG: hypothetical protein V1790_12580 [Planctomycetota bacterium]
MTYDRVRGVSVVFGGFGNARLGDVWVWDGVLWMQLQAPDGPRQRYDHAMAYDSRRDVTVVFGGEAETRLDDTWELSSCPVDSDGDGVPDLEDACPNSDLAETVVIGDCDSGVATHLFDDGCTMADRIAECATGAGNHGNFVGCVTQLTHDWVDEGVITPRDKGPIQRCAAQADVPQPHVTGRNLSKGESTAPTETLRRR